MVETTFPAQSPRNTGRRKGARAEGCSRRSLMLGHGHSSLSRRGVYTHFVGVVYGGWGGLCRRGEIKRTYVRREVLLIVENPGLSLALAGRRSIGCVQ